MSVAIFPTTLRLLLVAGNVNAVMMGAVVSIMVLALLLAEIFPAASLAKA